MSVLCLAAVLASTPASAAVILPSVDRYRLIFTTYAQIVQTSGDIATYDAFVTEQATASGLPSSTWKVVGSTATVSARDHVLDGWDVPICNTVGELVADNWADLWDGSIRNLVCYTRYGDLSWSSYGATGTKWNGKTATWSLGTRIPEWA